MDKRSEGCLLTFFVLAVVVCASFIEAWLAQWLWGLIVVDLWNAPVISYWQMYGLIWMIRLILPSRVRYKKED